MKIAALFTSKPGQRVHPAKAALNLLAVCALLVAVFWLSLTAINVTFDFSFVGDFRRRLWRGFWTTVELSVLSLVISLFVGVLSALGQGSRVLAVRYFCDIYVKFIRGTPLIMQIYLFFYIIGTAWGVTNRLVAGALILSIFEGAYIAEIIRGSLLSLDESQLEAARAVGFTKRQSARLVVLPQLVARTLPALTGQFASIIKDSSLLSIIAVSEFTLNAQEVNAFTYSTLESYLPLAVGYLLLTLPISLLGRVLERRFRFAA